MAEPIMFAIPKGRILQETLPLLEKVGLTPEADFYNPDSRSLIFATENAAVHLIRVRAFDVATFVAHGAATMGIVGSDVIEEFRYSELYAPVDLGVGRCRLALAAAKRSGLPDAGTSHLRVATKYPNLTRAWFEQHAIQAEPIALSGAMEIAPKLGLAPYIVDLVSTGQTLLQNGLEEQALIRSVSARLIVNRAAFKLQGHRVRSLIEDFRAAVEDSRV